MAFMVSGVAIWLPAYSDLSLPNALIGYPLWVILLSAFFTKLFSKHGAVIISLSIGAAPLVAYFLRMMVDTAKDPTSHNLWPIALFIIGVVCFPAAALGSSLAWFLDIVRKKYLDEKPHS